MPPAGLRTAQVAEKSITGRKPGCSCQDPAPPGRSAKPRRRNALDPEPGCSLQETERGACRHAAAATAGYARPRPHATAGMPSNNRDGFRAISSGCRGPPRRKQGRPRSCGDGIRRGARAGNPADCRNSDQAGTSMVRMTAGNCGNCAANGFPRIGRSFEEIRRHADGRDLEADVEYLPIPANGSPIWRHWLRPIPPEMVSFLAAPDRHRQ